LFVKPSDAIAAQRDKILAIAAAYGASNLRVFGSVAKGEDRQGSDLDLLVDVRAGTSLFQFAGLQLEIEDALGNKSRSLHRSAAPSQAQEPHPCRSAPAMSERDELYLEHILEAIAAIKRYTAGGRAAFFADDMVQSAVVRQLEIIGEAAKNGPVETGRAHKRSPDPRLFPDRPRYRLEYCRARAYPVA
jgi:predicted nucleotidyltransferase